MSVAAMLSQNATSSGPTQHLRANVRRITCERSESGVAPMSMLYRDGEHLGSELRLQNLARSGSLAAQHGLEHHAGDVSLQAAARLPAAHPLGALALHVGDRRRMHTRLRDGDHVDDGVEAAVAAAIESMARRLARGDRQG